MNRRGFIGTLTALAGIVLAKIKAPAAEWRPGITTLASQEPITGLVETSKNLYLFTNNCRFTYTYTPDVGWQWLKDDRWASELNTQTIAESAVEAQTKCPPSASAMNATAS